ncbi:MAG TPA: hypothetical protein VJL89_06915 [Thermodesulfovibrionia bacterium]|nr:hypothetical protein [Thermodesulfovibrionia bacterium]
MNNEIQGQFSPPDTKSWFEYSWKLQQDVPARYEDAAKFLATMISLSLTIFTTALDKLKVISFPPVVLLVSLVIWLIAMFFAFHVLWPKSYYFYDKSVESVKKAQKEIIHTKKKYFTLSAVLYFVPFVILILTYVLTLF